MLISHMVMVNVFVTCIRETKSTKKGTANSRMEDSAVNAEWPVSEVRCSAMALCGEARRVMASRFFPSERFIPLL